MWVSSLGQGRGSTVAVMFFSRSRVVQNFALPTNLPPKGQTLLQSRSASDQKLLAIATCHARSTQKLIKMILTKISRKQRLKSPFHRIFCKNIPYLVVAREHLRVVTHSFAPYIWLNKEYSYRTYCRKLVEV